MSKYDHAKVRAALDAALVEYHENIETALDRDFAAARAATAPGQTVPKRASADRPRTDVGRDAVRAARDAYNNKVGNIIDAARRDLMETITEPPSGKARAALDAVRGRENVTPTELDSLLGLYGDSYQVRAAVADIAARSKAISEGDRLRYSNTAADPMTAFDEFARDYARATFIGSASHMIGVLADTPLDRANSVLEGI